jgi:hypothetical protein
MRNFFVTLLLIGLTGCGLLPLKPGTSSITPKGARLTQSQNPAEPSEQDYEKTVTTEPATKLPEDDKVVSKALRTTITEKVHTTIGAAQKDTAREISSKLRSLKGVVWVGVLLFVFGAASAFYPPLKIIVGSVTTSAVISASGLALIILPSLIVGNEILILSIGAGAAGLYWFSHRHGELRGKLNILEKK